MDYLERREEEKKDNGQTPFLFFIALGLGIVFTNLWVILGLRYCCRQRRRRQELEAAGYPVTPSDLEHGRSDEWAFYLNPLFAGRPSYYRRLDRRLVTKEDLDKRFPVVKYKEWTLEREREGLSADGGISLGAAVANGKADDDGDENKGEATEEMSEKEHGSSQEDQTTRPSTSVQLPPTPPESPKPETAEPADCTPGDLCSVCLDVLEPENDVRVLTCEHVFHDECITRWLTTRRGLCPLCKRDYCPRPLYTPPARRTAATASNRNATTNEETTNENTNNNTDSATTNNETTTNDDTIQRPEPAHHNDDAHRHRRRWFIRRQPSNRRIITMAPFI